MVPPRPATPLPVPEQWGAPEPAVGGEQAVPGLAYFPDERLQALLRVALANNRDLRLAVLNIEQARAALDIQRADQLPTVNATASATRQPASASPYRVGTVASAGLSLVSFELDLFGRVRALSEAAAAQLLATQEARKAAQVSLVAAVASAYYAVWADRWQVALADETLRTRQESLRLLTLRYDAGVLNDLDWRTAQSQVEAARVSRVQAQRQAQLNRNALALLLGQPVPESALPPAPDVVLPSANSGERSGAKSVAQTPPAAPEGAWPLLSALPVGLPSQVLLKRPDILAAEQALLAANANIGAARAARFPRIVLTGSAGVVSDALSGLISDGRSAWSLGGSLAAPLLDAGRSAANVKVAEVRRDAALVQYDKAVQTAFREVSDALVARSTWAEQRAAQQALLEAESARYQLSSLRYTSGVANPVEWLDAQRSVFAAQQALISAHLAGQQAHIAVFKALGGGLE